jgi:hypothetical protein
MFGLISKKQLDLVFSGLDIVLGRSSGDGVDFRGSPFMS